MRHPKLIVALDVDSFRKAKYLVNLLYPKVRIFKIGSILFSACGPKIIRFIKQKGALVLLDLKFHDIPNTVSNASRVITRLGIDFFTLHIQGGREMMVSTVCAVKEEANKLRIKRPKILGVTVLTSHDYVKHIHKSVLSLAKLAKESGLDGIVCSVNEAPFVRKEFGKDFIIATPGIRPIHALDEDQRRIATPREAIEGGANYIIVGRPIINSDEPLTATSQIIKLIHA
jgi:orotidine-5'-phosphate decarboxylase